MFTPHNSIKALLGRVVTVEVSLCVATVEVSLCVVTVEESLMGPRTLFFSTPLAS